MVAWVLEFSSGGTKFERFLPKNQHTQLKLLNFENWCNGGGVKKCLNFQRKKLLESFSFFFIKECHFLFLTFFDSIYFSITLFSKMMPNFWHLSINQFSKFSNFLGYVDFLAKIYSNFVPSTWKLVNRYYHNLYGL